jgi:hypothetical protein
MNHHWQNSTTSPQVLTHTRSTQPPRCGEPPEQQPLQIAPLCVAAIQAAAARIQSVVSTFKWFVQHREVRPLSITVSQESQTSTYAGLSRIPATARKLEHVAQPTRPKLWTNDFAMMFKTDQICPSRKRISV